MRSRLTKLGVALAAIVALAVGGSALASASHNSTPTAQPPVVAQSQQGDQAGNDQTAVEQTDSQVETADSESSPGDGPGGYADTNPNADTEQQGEH